MSTMWRYVNAKPTRGKPRLTHLLLEAQSRSQECSKCAVLGINIKADICTQNLAKKAAGSA
jgi:recombinational DNA repair protein RecR